MNRASTAEGFKSLARVSFATFSSVWIGHKFGTDLGWVTFLALCSVMP